MSLVISQMFDVGYRKEWRILSKDILIFDKRIGFINTLKNNYSKTRRDGKK